MATERVSTDEDRAAESSRVIRDSTTRRQRTGLWDGRESGQGLAGPRNPARALKTAQRGGRLAPEISEEACYPVRRVFWDAERQAFDVGNRTTRCTRGHPALAVGRNLFGAVSGAERTEMRAVNDVVAAERGLCEIPPQRSCSSLEHLEIEMD